MAYDRAPLPVILATIAAAAPAREALLRDANRRGARPPPLSVAKLIAIAPGACRLLIRTATIENQTHAKRL